MKNGLKSRLFANTRTIMLKETFHFVGNNLGVSHFLLAFFSPLGLPMMCLLIFFPLLLRSLFFIPKLVAALYFAQAPASQQV
jgi:hypothetical protein